MNIEEQIEDHNQRVYQGEMPAANKEAMRRVIVAKQTLDEKWSELSTSDYNAADAGMHWSDNK